MTDMHNDGTMKNENHDMKKQIKYKGRTHGL